MSIFTLRTKAHGTHMTNEATNDTNVFLGLFISTFYAVLFLLHIYNNNNEYWNDFPVFIMIILMSLFLGENLIFYFFYPTTTTDAIRSIPKHA